MKSCDPITDAIEEHESFYASLQEKINHNLKDGLIIIDDWNVKVGKKQNQMLLENFKNKEQNRRMIHRIR